MATITEDIWCLHHITSASKVLYCVLTSILTRTQTSFVAFPGACSFSVYILILKIYEANSALISQTEVFVYSLLLVDIVVCNPKQNSKKKTSRQISGNVSFITPLGSRPTLPSALLYTALWTPAQKTGGAQSWPFFNLAPPKRLRVVFLSGVIPPSPFLATMAGK